MADRQSQIGNWFGRTFACECGRTHTIEPNWIVYADDAVRRVPEVCGRCTAGRRVAVLMDARTRSAAGDAVVEALRQADWQVTEVVVPDGPDGSSPVCDDATAEALKCRLGDVDLLLPVGSGVLSDLGKWLAFERDLPYAAFATAASMNGYTSANVAPTIEGVKGLLRARPPGAVLTSPGVLRGAPYEMTAAGLGDALAKSVSSADWYLNHVLFGDYYCPRSVGLVEEVEPLYLEHPEEVSARWPRAIEGLFQALLLTGAAMTMAETSSPASGGEHLISHCLDMMSSLDGVPHDLHGRQVGVGTVLTSELYRRLLATDSPAFAEPPGGVDAAFWGRLGGLVADRYAEKAPRVRAAAEALATGGTWDDLRRRLGAMLRPPEAIQQCLSRAGAAFRAEHIGCDRGRLLAALAHAHEMRSRFTVLDLARIAGLLPKAAEDLVDQWA